MSKVTDADIGKLLRDWTGRYSPPANGRARLLWEAAHASRKKVRQVPLFLTPQFKQHPALDDSQWAQSLFQWVFDNSYQVGMRALVC